MEDIILFWPQKTVYIIYTGHKNYQIKTPSPAVGIPVTPDFFFFFAGDIFLFFIPSESLLLEPLFFIIYFPGFLYVFRPLRRS
jgi:hypothetical protein